MIKELGRISQGYKNVTKGTNTVEFMSKEEIAKIPKHKTVTYARITADYRKEKKDPYRIRITVGGNLIKYPGPTTSTTADITTSKLLWNSVISTPESQFIALDVKNYYLQTPLKDPEYMKKEFMQEYNLKEKVVNDHIYMKIIQGMYGLPQAGRLANNLLKQRLSKYGYYETNTTPGLWKHTFRPIYFTLIVDDFGIKFTNIKNAMHLIETLKKWYKIEVDWTGS